MALLDRVNKDKLQNLRVPDARKQFNELLRSVSGSSQTRHTAYNIFYQIVGFKGVVEGVGCSTIVANTAIAIAKAGCSVCVVDTSILAPVQDIFLKTDASVIIENDGKEHLDWFDMPYTKKSVLHISKVNTNISVLSFKGAKLHSVVDVLSSNDSGLLVDMAFEELRNKFDVILVDLSHELSEVATTALQQCQKVIQVWSDVPHVLGNMESFITNMVTLSCPMDKMRNVICSHMSKDIIGGVDDLLKQYRLTKIATSYMSSELYLLAVSGKTLFNVESTDELVGDFTTAIIDVAAHILNVEHPVENVVTSNDIMDGKVEGTLHKKMKDEAEAFAKDHPEVKVDRNPMGHPDYDETSDDEDDSEDDSDETDAADDVDEEEEEPKKKKGLFGRRKK